MKRKILLLALTFLVALAPLTLGSVAEANNDTLGTIPAGQILVDEKGTEWIKIKNNHPGYPAGSSTFLMKNVINQRFHTSDVNVYETSSIRTYLNNTLYNSYSQNFRDVIMPTDITALGAYSSFTAKTLVGEKIWLPSVTELSNKSADYTNSYHIPIGTNWGYFTNDASRVATGHNGHYWTRSPYSNDSGLVWYVSSGGNFYDGLNASSTVVGVRPALNLKSGQLAKSLGSNKWEIIYNSQPELNITNPGTNQTPKVGSSFTISGTVKDEDNDSVTIKATVGGKEKTASITGTSAQKSWTLSWTFAEVSAGSHANIVVTANDGKTSAVTKTYTGTILVDKTAPTITITGVENSKSYVAPGLKAKIVVSDTGGSSLDTSKTNISYKVDGGADVNYTSETVFTKYGDYVLSVTVEDKAGNTASQNISFKITPPQPLIEFISNTLNSFKVKDNQVYTDTITYSYKLNGSVITNNVTKNGAEFEFTNLIANKKYGLIIEAK